MVTKMVAICDICKHEPKQMATTKCNMCNADICPTHNFGDINIYIKTEIRIMNPHDFIKSEIDVKNPLMDCCPSCAHKLADILEKNKNIIENKINENNVELKSLLLKEFKIKFDNL